MNTLTGVSLIIQLPSIRSFIIVINLSDLWLVQLFTLESQVLMLHCKFDLGDWSHLDEFNETEERWEIANLFSVIEGWKMCSEIEIIPMQTRGKWLVKRFRRCHRPLGPFRFGRTEIGFQVKGFYSKFFFFVCVLLLCFLLRWGRVFKQNSGLGGKKMWNNVFDRRRLGFMFALFVGFGRLKSVRFCPFALRFIQLELIQCINSKN